MSELLNVLALQVLRNDVFTSLPPTVQTLFPTITDPISGTAVPNFVIGHPSEQSSAPQWPMVTVNSSKAGDVTVPNIGQLDLMIDVWVSAQSSLSTTARTLISTIYEYIRAAFAQTNWSGLGVQIQQSWEKFTPEIMYEPPEKLYHLSGRFGVEAFSPIWY